MREGVKMKFEADYSYEFLIKCSFKDETVKVSKQYFIDLVNDYLSSNSFSRDILNARRTALKLFDTFTAGKSFFYMGNSFLGDYFRWYKSLDHKLLTMHAHSRSTGSLRELYLA